MKRALLVGINAYPTSPLRGCVNDVEDIHGLITSVGGYRPDDVRALCDARATTGAIKERLAWLQRDSKPGDDVFFSYSGHGSQVRDRGVQDELADHMDEILCPVDLDWDQKLITDDDLGDWLRGFQPGVKLTLFLDCCHSGTGTRDLRPPMENPHYKADRYLHPPLDIELRGRMIQNQRAIGRVRLGRGEKSGFTRKRNAKKRGFFSWLFRPTSRPKPKPVVAPVVATPSLNHVLIAGCRSDQTSADAFINGRYNGALTHYFTKSLLAGAARPLSQVHAEARQAILTNGYSQESQLEGPESLLSQPIFVKGV